MSDLTTEDLAAHYAARVTAFQPIGDQLLVELEHHHSSLSVPIARGAIAEAKTAGGIIVPQTIEPDLQRTRFARVIAAGPGRWAANGGARCPMSCAVGDRVVLDEICLRGPFPEVAPGFHVVHDEQTLGVVEET